MKSHILKSFVLEDAFSNFASPIDYRRPAKTKVINLGIDKRHKKFNDSVKTRSNYIKLTPYGKTSLLIG